MTSPLPSPWWRPENHQDRRPFLLGRNAIQKAVRGWFEGLGFTEVEAAALAISPGNEAHLHAFATEAITTDGQRSQLYLHTSPEFACKKLLAAGETKIFDFAKVWRNRERGPLHHPEFTMLEWYRVEAPYETLMADCQSLLALAAETVGAERLSYRGHACDPFAEAERVTVAEAFERWAGVDLLMSVAVDGTVDRERLAAQAPVRVAEDDTWSDIVSRILVEKIEPQLGMGRPTLLTEYPIAQAALARPKPGNPKVAERFELYACGVELANAFGELTDIDQQRDRLGVEMDEKQRVYGERYPIDEDFLAALAVMPQASGAALGFDRLVMLATGAARIDQVIWTPVPDQS
ncbi:MAG: EF-P lysine aminoacylase GenX [Phenylobacterium sp.]|nr:EF-P lysine aminoacylase GenX [Phenylobacterium sp.]